jgi:hypothetical protein
MIQADLSNGSSEVIVMNNTQLLPPPVSAESLPPPGAGHLLPPVNMRAQRRRRWPWVLLGVGVAFVALAVLGLILSALAPTSLVDDDLDDGSGPFAHESDELVTLDYVDGGYAMILEPAPANWQTARSFCQRRRLVRGARYWITGLLRRYRMQSSRCHL